jgi:hypothetical protein
MVTPLQTLGNWFTSGKQPRQPALPRASPPPHHPRAVLKGMSGHSHTYELEKSRSGAVSRQLRITSQKRLADSGESLLYRMDTTSMSSKAVGSPKDLVRVTSMRSRRHTPGLEEARSTKRSTG